MIIHTPRYSAWNQLYKSTHERQNVCPETCIIEHIVGVRQMTKLGPVYTVEGIRGTGPVNKEHMVRSSIYGGRGGGGGKQGIHGQIQYIRGYMCLQTYPIYKLE